MKFLKPLPALLFILLSVILLTCSDDDNPFNSDDDYGPFTMINDIVDYNGTIYAIVDSCSHVYSDDCTHYISKWNGSDWIPIVSGLDSGATVLTIIGGNLVFGGDFTQIGDVAISRVAGYNLTNGTLFSYDGSINNGDIRCLGAWGSIYIGGTFSSTDQGTVKNIAKYSGGWNPVGGGTIGGVTDIIEYNGNIIAGGQISYAYLTKANYIAGWNGSSWFTMGDGVDEPVLDLEIYNGSLIVGAGIDSISGAIGISRWDGSNWYALGGGISSGPYFSGSARYMKVFGSDLIVAGDFETAGGIASENIAKWNGSSWSGFGSGLRGSVFGMTISSNTIYVSGYFTNSKNNLIGNFARWNGSAWVYL